MTLKDEVLGLGSRPLPQVPFTRTYRRGRPHRPWRRTIRLALGVMLGLCAIAAWMWWG